MMTDPGPATMDMEFEAVLEAVRQTARGRWFLSEFERRNRSADTVEVLRAVNRLGRIVASSSGLPRPSNADTQASSSSADRLKTRAKHEDLIIRMIAGAAEQIQEAAWTLRAEGASVTACRSIDERVDQILACCNEIASGTEDVREAAATIRAFEERLSSIGALLDRHMAKSPKAEVQTPRAGHSARGSIGLPEIPLWRMPVSDSTKQ